MLNQYVNELMCHSTLNVGKLVPNSLGSKTKVQCGEGSTSIVRPMRKTNDIKDNFSALLRDSLRSRFGRIPSAAVVAREFNLRAYDTAPISQESARRWIRGVSLPEEERLRVLVNWLDLDFNKVLRAQDRMPGRGMLLLRDHGGNSHGGNGQAGNADISSGHNGNGHVGHGNGLTERETEVLQLISGLTDDQKRVLLDLIKAGFSSVSK